MSDGGGVGREDGERGGGCGERWGSACDGVGLGRGCDGCVGPGRMGWGKFFKSQFLNWKY